MKPKKSLKVKYKGFINYKKVRNLNYNSEFPNKDYY